MKATKNNYNQILHNISFVLVIYNWRWASTNPDVSINNYLFNVYLMQTTWTNNYATRSPNFAISPAYATPSGFDGNCLAGMQFVRMGGQQTSQDYINMTTNPIDATLVIVRDNPAAQYAIRTDHVFLCVLQIHYNSECSQLFGLQPACNKCKRGVCLSCKDGMALDTLTQTQCVCLMG